MKTKLTLLLSLILIASVPAGVLPNDALVDGKTMGEWGAEQWKWIFPIPVSQNPSFDTNGSLANVAQPDGPVFFLTKGFNISLKGARAFTVPEGKYLFVPLLSTYWDNTDTVVPFTKEQLHDLVEASLNQITELHATIDGGPVPDLFAHRAITPVFAVYFNNEDNLITHSLLHPFTGWDDPIVAGGYYLMVEPLALGTHVINFGGTVGPPVNYTADMTDTIKVVPANKPPLADASATRSRVFSPNNHNAAVVLDGLRSSDPDNDPLTYAWLEGASVLAVSAISTNILGVGTHVISLVVSDGKLSATNTVTVEVLTPCAALGELAGAVEAAKLSRKKARPLVEELREACAAFEHGFKARHHDRQEHVEHAIHELREFQHEVREELGRSNPSLAALLIDGAQEIIEAIKPVAAHHHGEGNRNEDDRD